MIASPFTTRPFPGQFLRSAVRVVSEVIVSPQATFPFAGALAEPMESAVTAHAATTAKRKRLPTPQNLIACPSLEGQMSSCSESHLGQTVTQLNERPG